MIKLHCALNINLIAKYIFIFTIIPNIKTTNNILQKKVPNISIIIANNTIMPLPFTFYALPDSGSFGKSVCLINSYQTSC